MNALIASATLKTTRFILTNTVGEIAVEAFTCLLIFKNIFSFGLAWQAYPWVVDGGIAKIFNVIASVQLGICLLGIPMCKSWITAMLMGNDVTVG